MGLHPTVTPPRPKCKSKHSILRTPTVEILTVHVQLLSLVLQRHQVLGFGNHCFKPAQTSGSLLFGLLRSSLSQEVVQVLGQIVGLFRGPGSIRRWRRAKEGRQEKYMERVTILEGAKTVEEKQFQLIPITKPKPTQILTSLKSSF